MIKFCCVTPLEEDDGNNHADRSDEYARGRLIPRAGGTTLQIEDLGQVLSSDPAAELAG